jgi:hypothetical protein
VFLSCVFINFIFVFLTSGQDCNSGMQKRIHFRTDMEHYICRPVNNSDVSLGYQFCKDITFILYIIYNVRYINIQLLPACFWRLFVCGPLHSKPFHPQEVYLHDLSCLQACFRHKYSWISDHLLLFIKKHASVISLSTIISGLHCKSNCLWLLFTSQLTWYVELQAEYTSAWV